MSHVRRLLALLSLILLTGCATKYQGDNTRVPAAEPSDPHAVVWLDLPTTPPNPTPVATSRNCTVADLPQAATSTRTTGVMQAESALIHVRNVGSSRCTLSGTPTLLHTVAGDQLRPVPADLFPAAFGQVPATLNPGETGDVVVVLSHACDRPSVVYKGFVVQMAGRRIPVSGLTLTGTCPTLLVGNWYQPAAEAQPQPSPHYTDLTATIEAPPTIHAGEQLDYSVTLTNSTSSPIALSPCPVYRELFYKNLRTYQLNCAPGSIPAAASARFAMRIDVLAYTPAGPNRLSWSIVDANTQSASAVTTVAVTL